MELTGMVAEHIASLPPPPQLMAYAPPRLGTRGRWCHRHPMLLISDNDMTTHTGK
jgi:hypothetical protein